MQLSEAQGEIGSPNEATVTITDDDGKMFASLYLIFYIKVPIFYT